MQGCSGQSEALKRFLLPIIAISLGGCLEKEELANTVAPPDPPNSAPMISGTPPASVHVGMNYSFLPTSDDPDGDTLTFSIKNKPAWVTFDTTTGELSGVPTAADVNVYSNISISATDGQASTSIDPFSVEVISPTSPPDRPTGPGTVSAEWSPPLPPTGGPTATKTVDVTWKEALSQIAGGGTLIVEPGHHITTADDWVYFSNWEYLVIRGVLDANGNRPILEHVPLADGTVSTNWITWGGTNGNLWIQDVRFKGAGSNLLAGGSGSNSEKSQKIVLDNVEMSYAGHHIIMFSFEWTGTLSGDARLNPVNDELWIRDSSFHHSGATHVLYADRIAKLVVVNSKFFSPASTSGHAFKAIARQIVVEGSEISNVLLNGEIDTDTSHYSSSGVYKPTEMYLGAVPVSLVAGQTGIFQNNRVTHRTDANYNTGAYCVDQQVRHAIHALEVPDPKDLAGTFYNPDFWHQIVNDGLDNLDNPGLWVTRFTDNEYILLGDSGDMAAQMVYHNAGTYPIETGFPLTPIKNIPGEWVERSRTVVSGDRVRGFTKTGRYLYDARSPVPAVSDNPSLNPTEGTADNPGGGRFVILSEPTEF
jgi:hypothetical protein